MPNKDTEYISIYKEYVRKLIASDGNNPAEYNCTYQRIDEQREEYKIGFLWPTADGGTHECGYWPRLPNIEEEPSGIIYKYISTDGENTYLINVFSPKWFNRVLIVRFVRDSMLCAV